MKTNAPSKGRGAVISPDGRFDAWQREAAEDGWWNEGEEAPTTELIVDAAKSVITYNSSPDIPYDRSINPYRGCEHVMWNSAAARTGSSGLDSVLLFFWGLAICDVL